VSAADARQGVTDDDAVTAAVDDAVLAGSYEGVTEAPLDTGKAPPKKVPALKGDLVVIAVFDRPAGTTEADEIALANADAWSPSTTDFLIVAGTGPRGAGNVPSCTNVGEFLGAIQAEPEGSLSRVVIVSHSTSGLLGFGGSISSAGGVGITKSGGFGNPLAGGVDLNAINGLKDQHATLLEDVRKRWAGGSGELLFFSCGTGAGVNLALMQELAKLIGASAKGFSGPIGYLMDHDTKSLVTARGLTTLTFVKNAKNQDVPDRASARLGYRHLTPNRP
jgi:hypothetical protein